MAQSHYSLRWNNHQSHILAAFEALLQHETLVDVTLVCDATDSVRAHKVVLSACSPFFQRIFADHPCKHPVIVLKDFRRWEVQAIVDFMYKGEISVAQEQLSSLLKAAESLQVRGLANQEQFSGPEKENGNAASNRTPTPSPSPNDYDRFYGGGGRFPTPGVTVRTPGERGSPYSPLQGPSYEPPLKLPHMSHLSFPDTLLPRQECQSPLPRRKQARPRRRSGEICTPQDLSTSLPKSSSPAEETAENLCVKKTNRDGDKQKEMDGNRETTTSESVGSPEMDLHVGNSKDYTSSPPLNLPPVLSMNHDIDNHSPLPFPPMPSVGALAMTPPHSKFFGLDSPLGLFSTGLEGRNPLLEMAEQHRTTPDSQFYPKKKLGRPKGQHSAPRGGPPRSWTNAELTEALQHVWNKKMTTSQASRVFGIPYNSLLMYVRGKYGKSLKLEQLRKDCIGAPALDLMNISNNNNSSCKIERDSEQQQNTRPSSTEESAAAAAAAAAAVPPAPVYNPFPHAFYSDYGTGFPIPVNMLHLLSQSEKTRDYYAQHQQQQSQQQQQQQEEDCNSKSVKKEMEDEQQQQQQAQDMFRSAVLSRDDRREVVQQNGQD